MANSENNNGGEEVITGESFSDLPNVLPTKRANFVKPKEDVFLEDIIKEHALPFLPAKSLCRFRAVSKEWNRWISCPFLAHKQTTYFKDISGILCQSRFLEPSFISFHPDSYGIPNSSLNFLPEPVRIKATCNGLVCCQSRLDEYVYYICNPVTQDWQVLPEPMLCHGRETAIALTFEPGTLNFSANYDLACAVPVTEKGFSVVYFEIYSKMTNSWRVSDTICGEPDALKLSNDGFYMKSIVYWKTLSGAVLAFDLKTEQYGILPLPSGCGSDGALTQMDGELRYILPQIHDGECTMNVYGNMDMSLKHVIPLKSEVGEAFEDCRVLTCVNNNILVILLPNRVIAYHVREQKVELLSEERTKEFEYCLPYINTLVSVAK